MRKVYFASDHAGFALKRALLERVRALGCVVEDMGAEIFDTEDDYPDFITPLAKHVALEAGSIGVVIGGSGEGEAMCSNRVSGVRASVFYGPARVVEALDIEGEQSEDGYDIVRLSRMHNDANILSIGARFVSVTDAYEAVRVFIETPFSGSARHARRLAKF